MKTHVIYMKENEFSVKMTEDTIKSLEKFNIEYELFDGVKGREGIGVLGSYGVAPSSYVGAGEWTDGTIGCLASHYILWDQCSKQDEPFLILEQDGVLIRDPREILPLIDKVCHLDAYLPFDLKEGISHFEKYNANLEVENSGVKEHPASSFYETNNITGYCFRGTYGYIIKPEGAKEIIEFVKNNGAFPSDRTICSNATHIQRARSTYVRLNPFFQSLDEQRKFSLR